VVGQHRPPMRDETKDRARRPLRLTREQQAKIIRAIEDAYNAGCDAFHAYWPDGEIRGRGVRYDDATRQGAGR
jgi:hypothetical protein